jgi:hypothetical protein
VVARKRNHQEPPISFLSIEQLDQLVSQLDERKAMTDMTTSPPLAGTQQVPGSVGNTVSVWRSILWAIPTLGIYAYVWTYRERSSRSPEYSADSSP